MIVRHVSRQTQIMTAGSTIAAGFRKHLLPTDDEPELIRRSIPGKGIEVGQDR